MPWKETQVREERLKFIAAYLEGEWTMSELCRAYGISRPTGYEVLARYQITHKILRRPRTGFALRPLQRRDDRTSALIRRLVQLNPNLSFQRRTRTGKRNQCEDSTR